MDQQTHMPDAPASGPGDTSGFDVGTESLSRALQLSFAGLKVVIVVLAAAYLFSGIYTVQPHEQALRLHFGKVEEVVGPGGYFAWPFPIDEIIRIESKKGRDLEIGTFWYSTAMGRGEKAMREERDELRNIPKSERVSGMGGYCLTGDLNILHYYWTVRYQISDPLNFYRNVIADDVKKYATSQEEYYASADRLVKYAVESAIVRTVNEYEVYDAMQNKVKSIARRVQQRAQDILSKDLRIVDEDGNDSATGIEIVQVVASMPPIPPQVVASAFKEVFQAREGRSRDIEVAEGEVNDKMAQACGEVGRPVYQAFAALDLAEEGLRQAADLKEDLADVQEKLAATKGDKAVEAEKARIEAELKTIGDGAGMLARMVTKTIDPKFLGEDSSLYVDYESLRKNLPAAIDKMYVFAGGGVAAEINKAKSYKVEVVQQARADTEKIGQLLAKRDNLATYLTQLRIETLRESIGGVDDVYFLHPAQGQLRIKISAPPDLLKRKRAIEDTR